MTYAIIATLVFVYFSAAFIRHCAASICRRHKALISQAASEVVEAIAQPLEITPVIEPMSFGEGVELSVDIPTSIRALKKFVRTHSLQKPVREYAGKSYSSLNLAQLSEAVGVAIAA